MASIKLTQQGAVIPVSVLRARFGAKYDQMLEKLTLVFRQKKGPPKYARMYKIETVNNQQVIWLPRFSAESLHKAGVITEVVVDLPPVIAINPTLRLDLYANQKLIIDHLLKTSFTPARAASGFAGCILNLRAGMGKTFVAAGVINALRVRTLYVVPKINLREQAVRDLKMCFYPDGGVPEIIVGAYGKPKKRDRSTDPANQSVTVIVINSAINRDAAFFAGYQLVIFDEEHMYCSDVNRNIFWQSHSRYMFGISATTEDRKDGFDPIAHKQLGPIIRAEEIPGFTYDNIEFDSLVTIVRYCGPPEHTRNLTHEATKSMFTPYMMKQFMEDPHRVRLILNYILELYNWVGPAGQRHCIFVFCEEREFVKMLSDRLKAEIERQNINIGIAVPELDGVIGNFIGGIKDPEIRAIKDSARVLLTTYGYSGTGVSIDKMTAEIFATPRRANMKQILPRIMRRGGDISIQRRVIDLVDHKTGLKYQLGDRALAYEFYGMKVEEKKIKHDQV